jgi:hypothetical protein
MKPLVNSRTFPELRRVLAEWTHIQNALALDYSSVGDLPWWYNERASLGSFAGAVWKSGGDVLHEFQFMKADRSPSPKQRWRRGRCDIYFRSGSHSFVGEAKQGWPRLDTDDPAAVLKSGLENAKKDARALKRSRHRRIALLFLSFRLPAAQSESIETHIKSWNRALRSGAHCASASVFPECAKSMKSNGAYYPGTAIVIGSLR